MKAGGDSLRGSANNVALSKTMASKYSPAWHSQSLHQGSFPVAIARRCLFEHLPTQMFSKSLNWTNCLPANSSLHTHANQTVGIETYSWIQLYHDLSSSKLIQTCRKQGGSCHHRPNPLNCACSLNTHEHLKRSKMPGASAIPLYPSFCI